MAKTDGEVVIGTKLDNKGLEKGLDGLSKPTGKLAGSLKKLGGAVAAGFAVRKIVKFGKECIELGSDLAEVQNVVDVTFGDMSGAVDRFAKTTLLTAGLSETMAKRFAGTFGSMAKSFGFSSQEAFDMSASLTQLSGDVASFYNISQDEAFGKLKSVFTGETESLKDLGVVMTQTALDQYALSKGINITTAQMDEQSKVALRYSFVMDQLTDASGDFARTSDGWANQVRILSVSFDQLKATIGQGLITALTPVLQIINDVIAGLQVMADVFTQVISALFGLSTSGGGGPPIADGLDGAAESADNLAHSIGGVGGAAKKAQRQLAGFDEITKVSKARGGGGGGSKGGTHIDLGIPAFKQQQTIIERGVESTVKKVLKYLEPLREIDFGPLWESLQGLWQVLSDIAEIVGGALSWAWYNVLVPLSQWTIEEAAPAVVGVLAAQFRLLGNIVRPLWGLFTKLMDALQPVFELIGGLATQALEGIAQILNTIADFISSHEEEINAFFSGLAEVIGTVVEAIMPILESLQTVLGGVIEFINGVFSGDWESAWGGVKQIFSGIWEGIEGIFSAFGIDLEEDVIRPIKEFCSTITKPFRDAWESISIWWTYTVGAWWNKHIAPLFTAEFWAGKWDAFVGSIKSAVQEAMGWADKLLGKLLEMMGLGGGDAFNYMRKHRGGRSGGPTLSGPPTTPPVPGLARGAVLPPNKPFLAMVGDQRSGTNIEAPLDTIQGAFDGSMANHISAMMAGFEALLAEARALRQTVQDIDVGDITIGQAAARYNQQLSIMEGI